MINDSTFRTVFEYYGVESQFNKFLEELFELGAACSRAINKEIVITDTEFLEELADVENMLRHWELNFGIKMEAVENLPTDTSIVRANCSRLANSMIVDGSMSKTISDMIMMKTSIKNFKNHHGINAQVDSIREKKMQRVLKRIEEEGADV